MRLRLSEAEDRQRRVLAVHDISCLGRCSLTVALPMLSAAGLETTLLPTAVLSTHTGGFEGYTYRDLVEDMEPIAAHWLGLGLRFDGVFTGWLGTHRHIARMRRLMTAFADGRPELIVDPVMGDNGRLYATLDGDYVDAMRDFCGGASLLLPNLTEAALLTRTAYPGEDYGREDVLALLKALRALGPETVVLTGVSLREGRIGAAAWDGEALAYHDAPFIPGQWHGAGDVFACAMLGARFAGKDAAAALGFAVDFTARCIARTRDAGTDERLGLQFEPELWRMTELVKG